MTSAVAPATEANRGYINGGGGPYYHHVAPAYLDPSPVGHPSMFPYSSSQPNLSHHHHHPATMGPYYHHHDGYAASAQYVPEYAATMPHHHYPPPPPQHYHHHPAPQQHNIMYYGSWPGSGGPVPPPHPPAAIGGQHAQHVQYGLPAYAANILPHEAQQYQHRTRHGRQEKGQQGRQYGATMELNAFHSGDQNLVPALIFIKRSPNATLFDFDAKADEISSRFVQKRLKLGTDEERRLGLKAALSSLEELWGDPYGNFMLQGLLENGTQEMKKELMDALYEQDVVALCLHMNGCRVIQKAIRCLDQDDVCKLIEEFHDKVLTFIHDPHGNHVIQRCIQIMSQFAKSAEGLVNPDLASSLSDKMQFIIDDIVDNAESLSTHRYGCRVVQRAMEHCVPRQRDAVIERIVACHGRLVSDQYGNYVAQQVLACADDEGRDAILETLTAPGGALLALSKHKYASCVVEAVLVHGMPRHKEKLLEEMLKDTRGEPGGYCCVIELSKDPIANYVVNKAIEVSEGEQKEKFFEIISESRPELSKSPYAKYVLQRIAKRDKS